MTNTCDQWPVIWPCDVTTASPTLTGYAVDAAQIILDGLTAQQFGTCTVKIRPCRDVCFSDVPWGWNLWPSTLVLAGWASPWLQSWYAVVGCGACYNSCSCSTLQQVKLPAPAVSISEIRVDGSVLVTGAYRLDNKSLLVRIDGQAWPRCNDLTKDDTKVGTWSLTATYGQNVPIMGQMALGELACEFLKALRGEDCRLPQRVTQLARQGVTISYPSVSDSLSKGLLGLYLSDIFIRTVNPSGQSSRSKTFRVDGPTHRVVN